MFVQQRMDVEKRYFTVDCIGLDHSTEGISSIISFIPFTTADVVSQLSGRLIRQWRIMRYFSRIFLIIPAYWLYRSETMDLVKYYFSDQMISYDDLIEKWQKVMGWDYVVLETFLLMAVGRIYGLKINAIHQNASFK